MKKEAEHNTIINGLEVSVFRYALFLAVAFRLVRTIQEYLADAPMPALMLGILNLLLLAVLLRIYRKHYYTAFIIFYAVILITSFITWNSSGGWDGVVPYVMIIVIVAIVITSHGLLQFITLAAYGLGLSVLSSTGIPEFLSDPGRNNSLLSMEVDFFVSTSVFLLVTLYLKNRFLAYHSSVEATNSRLKQVSETLAAQTLQLNTQREMLNAIKDKLEATAATKIREVSTKTKVLNEYAFVNAHQVRGPLARVLGLIHLIEIETPDHERSDEHRRIKTEAQEMDTIVQRINEIIG